MLGLLLVIAGSQPDPGTALGCSTVGEDAGVSLDEIVSSGVAVTVVCTVENVMISQNLAILSRLANPMMINRLGAK